MEECVKNEIIEKTLTRTYSIDLYEDTGDPIINIGNGKFANGGPTVSRVGGKFAWEKDRPVPEDMIFLAQINFAELPENKVFPSNGLLQFFVKNDDLWGLDLLGGQSSYLVVYRDIPESFDVYETPAKDSPILKPAIMKFLPCMEAMSFSDYRFPVRTICNIEEFQGQGTKLLGYPDFCQGDPRENGNEEYNTLLFQLDSTEYVMWGDMGVANFFINDKKLEKRDFSDIFYTWDCY